MSVPFEIAVPAETLADLQDRLARSRWPSRVEGVGWDEGTDLKFLRELADWWRTGFDWRARERELNTFQHFRADIDGHGVHFIHERGRGPDPMPLILTHGWPSTFAEMEKVIPPLADPARFGGDPADSFDVVVPSLPGYGFSDRPKQPGIAWLIPGLWVRLMTEVLGYERFAAHGVDIGSFVTNRLGLEHRDRVIGIHVVHWAEPHVDPESLTAEERAFVEARALSNEDERGYAHIQRTRPQTLAYALNDSPVGLAAWIVEKWRAWSDRGFTKDEFLTTVMIYWVTQTIGSSMRLYREWGLASRPWPWMPVAHVPPGAGESAPLPPGRRIEAPARIALFLGHGPTPPPRSWLERAYEQADVALMPRGGHFPAMEEPELLVDDIRSFFRPLR